MKAKNAILIYQEGGGREYMLCRFRPVRNTGKLSNAVAAHLQKSKDLFSHPSFESEVFYYEALPPPLGYHQYPKE